MLSRVVTGLSEDMNSGRLLVEFTTVGRLSLWGLLTPVAACLGGVCPGGGRSAVRGWRSRSWQHPGERGPALALGVSAVQFYLAPKV